MLFLKDPRGVDRAARRAMLDAVNDINRRTYEELGDPETNARIAQYEMAYRMQTSVPGLTDLSDEPQSTWDLYGPEARERGTFAYNCLMARRMAELDARIPEWGERGEERVLPYLTRRAWRSELLLAPVVSLFPGRRLRPGCSSRAGGGKSR